MATGLLPFQSTGIRSCADPGYRKPDSQHRKSASSRWWTPLFGWSSEPDYIDPDTNGKSEAEPGLDRKPSRSRLAPGSFTEEKARKLRMLTTASHHDAMYHSAIASRLASDFSDRSDV
ncbi:hypothetical protein RJ639_042507 [Escallonia herrerae]|uniref:Uncharacterized protein n=1 Tax=Escallonia herrerae TaxID=1293975 RepID=A0AA89B4Q0_9ASTE|nr:hypothetical protein RJ639_042507 [Escallonia herrerae]